MFNKPRKYNMLGKGTFGCAYEPDMPCPNEVQSKKGKGKKFISKIQHKSKGSDREEHLGQRIMEIPKYDTMFAPIISSCDVKIEEIIQEIDRSNVDKCDVMTKDMKTDPNVQYRSYKMKFAGKQTLVKYIMSIATKSPKKLVKRILETQLYLLKSIDKLTQLTPPVVHYDLKDNNIMYDDKLGVPILIDFGLSIEVEPDAEYDHKTMLQRYYVYYPKYTPWCIEIVLLSYIVQKVVANTPQKIKINITDEDIITLKDICTQFISDSDLFNLGSEFSTEELAKYTEGLHAMIQGYLGQSWETLVHGLEKGYSTWDNYALAVIYYFFLYDIIISNKIQSMIIDKYKSILKKIIWGVPNKTENYRPSNTDTLKELKSLSQTIDKKEYNKLLLSVQTTLHP